MYAFDKMCQAYNRCDEKTLEKAAVLEHLQKAMRVCNKDFAYGK